MIHNNQSLLYVSYSWNFRHRLVRLYWYNVYSIKKIVYVCTYVTCRYISRHVSSTFRKKTKAHGQLEVPKRVSLPIGLSREHHQDLKFQNATRKTSLIHPHVLPIFSKFFNKENLNIHPSGEIIAIIRSGKSENPADPAPGKKAWLLLRPEGWLNFFLALPETHMFRPWKSQKVASDESCFRDFGPISRGSKRY